MEFTIFNFFRSDMMGLPFYINYPKVGVSRYIDTNGFAEKFYGIVYCDEFGELTKRGEPIQTATRDGINWRSHPFAKALKLAVEKRVDPFVHEEERNAKSRVREVTNKKLQERLTRVVDKLNEIAKEELGGIGNAEAGDGDDGKQPFLPESRFGFVPEYYSAQVGRRTTLLLRAAVPDVVEPGAIVTVESSSSEITVLTPSVSIERLPDYPSIGQAHIEIEGAQVGAEGIVTATLENLSAEALVRVISKKAPPPPPKPEKPKQHGLVHGVSFDPEAEPKQRVVFRRVDSTVVIATAAPSVCPYIGARGEDSETPQAQVLIAELVTEAVCKEIARRGVDNGTFLSFSDNKRDAIDQNYIRIQNQYAHRIHSAMVDSEFHRKETLELDRSLTEPLEHV